MRRLIFILLPAPVIAQGQTAEPDSLPAHTLDEITVVADAQRTGSTRTVYMPSAEEKDMATDGISLLSRMHIPQLSVNPIADAVRTAANQDVSIFINYHQATAEDVRGLNPKDVKKVEYLDFPVDPRFMRSAHVVNFITDVYAYGGYTKLSGKERFIVRSGEASVYSRFACRSMEYDMIISGDYDYNHHIGTSEDETYRLDSGDVRRESNTDTGRYRRRGMYTALRASWIRNRNLTWRNMLSYRSISNPVLSTSGFVSFSSLYPSEYYCSDAGNSNSAAEWNSELYASFGTGWSVNGTFRAELRRNRSYMDYTAGHSTIINNADEAFWWLRGDVQMNKSLSDKITAFASVSTGGGRTEIDYSGSSDAVNHFRQTFTGVYGGISMRFRKVSGSVDAGYAFESNRINGHTMHDRYPFTHINVQYAPDSRNSVSLWCQYATMSPDAAMKNPNVIRQSELMYISGNPNLKCSRHISANISYTWLPDNRWQMTAYAVAFRIADRQIAVYTPDGPDGMMLKQYRNDGDYNHGQIGARVTLKLLGGKLAGSVSPRLLLYHTTGSNRISRYPFTAGMSLDYYTGKFLFSAYWDSGSRYVDGETAYLRRLPMSYTISAGWASKGWNLQISAVNPFRSSWEVSHDTLYTRWFDSSIRRYGADYHRRLTLSITYTFNYGRKLKGGNEMNGQGSISSSILR